ncbi:lipocalin family protein [Pedobacter sp. P351]|uniref:lipocalin family protein n=1 Tax=Pedobacter superstes TaxID=3133441 RepID=UPI0030AEA7F4
MKTPFLWPCMLFSMSIFVCGFNADKTNSELSGLKSAEYLISKQNNSPSNSLKGKWYYSAILYKDGSLYELRNRQSGLDLHNNGSYNQNIWVGTNLQGREGKYSVSGKKLTLTPGGGKPEVFTTNISADGKLLTLKGTDGSGWKLERLTK